MNPVKIIIIGAGSRGTAHASYVKGMPDKAQIVGVAEPREFYRQNLVEQHNIQPQNIVEDWNQLIKREKFADAVVIATHDKMHVKSAITLANKGYHILLEKPMALNDADCRKVAAAMKKNNTIFAVCHVLRYTAYTQKLKAVIDSGAIGDIVSMQHLEPIGYWHYAHSYVRGNWNNEKDSTFILLAKSCHDLDWISYIMGEKCKSVSSFGSLKYFRKEEKPITAGDRCLDCDFEPQCPYSAKKIYLERVKQGETGWPINVLASEISEESIFEALKQGQYGRCVYECNNDVADHQVVNMQFKNDTTATFTLTAFTQMADRYTRIFGTKGEIIGDGKTITLSDFLSDKTKIIDTYVSDSSITGGHGGGDYMLMKSFIEAVASNDASKVLSGPEATLESHLMVFAAERARKEKKVIRI